MIKNTGPKWHAGKTMVVPGISRRLYDSETAFQICCAQWLRKQYSMTSKSKFAKWHHSANERQGARAGFVAKMMGQSKGFPDLINLEFRAAVELKVERGKLSVEQICWRDYLVLIGWRYEIVFTFQRFQEVVNEL